MTPQTARLRREVARLNSKAADDLTAVWRRMETAARAGVVLHDVLPAIVDQYGAAVAATAAVWYDELREKQGIPGRFEAIPAHVDDTGTHALVGWAEVEATTYDAFQVLIQGGMQRRIADFSRLTVSRSAIADPGAHGWRRVGLGNCDFCRMLIGRGAVYSEETADFRSHDHCQCGAEPAWH